MRGRLAGAAFHIVPDPDDPGLDPDIYATPSAVPAREDVGLAITIRLGPILASVEARLFSITSKEPAL